MIVTFGFIRPADRKGLHYSPLPSLQAKLFGSVAIVIVRTIAQYFHTTATWKYLMFTNRPAQAIQISHSPHSTRRAKAARPL